MEKDCIFCKIINGDIPSYKVYEDEIVMAFLDINPEANGHTLIIPKTHCLDLYNIEEHTLMHIMKCAKDISKNLTDKLNCDGFSLIQNNGAVQEVKHYHLHIIPFYQEKQALRDQEEILKILNS